MNDQKTRVLYVEDDAGLARLLDKRLRRHNCEMTWAADGGAGVELMRDGRFDVVAIDYEMPVMNGLQVLERIQAMPNPPPAIMVSGAGDVEIAITAMKLGAADYVVKNVDGSYLALLPRVIDRVLEKQRLQSEAIAAQSALREKTELLSQTLASISQGLSVFDQDLRLTAWNRVWTDLLGLPEDFLVTGMPLETLVAQSSPTATSPISENLIKARDGEPQVGEYRLAGRSIEVASSPMPNGGVVSTYTDISERKAGEEAQRVAAAVFQTSAEAMLITDPDMKIERCNPAFESLLGYTIDELRGQKPSLLTSEEHDEQFCAQLRQTLVQEGHWRGTAWNRKKDGTLSAQQVTFSRIDNEYGETEHFVAIYTDVTEQIRREEGVRHLAYHDALTGLPNRSLLLDRIGQGIESAKRDGTGFAVLFVDLDGFKPVNDNYGHRTGDILLQEVSKRLSARCRDSDTVARYGGDEFVVFLRNSDGAPTVGKVAQSLIDHVARPVTIEQQDLPVSLSIGIALYPQDDVTATGLIKKADTAMYEAKAAGKGRYAFYRQGMDSPETAFP